MGGIRVPVVRSCSRRQDRLPREVSMQNQVARPQAQLSKSEDRLPPVAENARDVFWLADPAISKLYYVTPSYESVWGQSLEILYRDPSSRLEAIVPQDRPRKNTASSDPTDRPGGYGTGHFPSAIRRASSTGWPALLKMSPSANGWKKNCGNLKKWKPSAGWQAALPTILIIC